MVLWTEVLYFFKTETHVFNMSKAIDKVMVDLVLISYNIEIIARFFYCYRR